MIFPSRLHPAPPITTERPPSRAERGKAGQPASARAGDPKSAARTRIELIKQRIAQLMQLLVMFGAKVSAAVLQELRQLGAELAAASAVLQSGAATTASVPANPPVGVDSEAMAVPPTTQVSAAVQVTHDADGSAAYAEQQHAADAADAAQREGKHHGQRAADDKTIAEAHNRLREAETLAERLEERRRMGLPDR